MAEHDSTAFREVSGRDFLMRLAHASRLGTTLGRLSSSLRWGLHDPLDGDEEEEELDLEEPNEQDELPSASGRLSLSNGSPSTSFLFAGRSFSGIQRLPGLHQRQEDWSVTATIYSYDVERGRLSGQMVAANGQKQQIVTYFEGEIIDNVNHTFWTGSKWGASPSRETDMRYWARCPGFSPTLRAAVKENDGRAPQLAGWRHVYMRWKECFFVVAPPDCPLTIAGFYYLSLDRATGTIGGYYYDSRSAPLQELQLKPVEYCGDSSGADGSGSCSFGPDAGARTGSGPASGEAPAGMAFGAYSLC